MASLKDLYTRAVNKLRGLTAQGGGVQPMALSIVSVLEMWTDQIVAVGAVRRVYFHVLVDIYDDETGQTRREWHYFGTTPAQKPPTSADPVFQHTYVSFPQDFDQLGQDANDYYYQLGIQAGMHREGLR